MCYTFLVAEELFTRKKFKQDSLIYIEGSKAVPVFYIVSLGELVETTRFPNFTETSGYKPGDTFGLIACLTGQDYFSRIVAKTDCELIVVKKKDIIPFLAGQKDIFLKVISIYSNKLRFLNQKLIALASRSIYLEMPEHLIETAQRFNTDGEKEKALYCLKKYTIYGKDEKLLEECRGIIANLENKEKITVPEPKQIQSRLIYDEGQIIFMEQEQGDNFFFIEQGKVKISHITKDREFILSILDEGEFFGEMALLNNTARSASAIAWTKTRIMTLHKDNLFANLQEPILAKIFTSLGKRLWYSYRRVLNLSYQNPIVRLYDFLDLLLSTREGALPDEIQLDISMEDLKVFTNTEGIPLKELNDFISDKNISINYGALKILNTTALRNKLGALLTHEKNMVQQAMNSAAMNS